MRVVVIGGGLGGTATAARLAKMRHAVTLVEASDTLGGALGVVSDGDFDWDSGAHHTLLPAVIRDLFRKSGRPLERELDLEPLEFIREHRFVDGSRLRLTGGSRAAQLRAAQALAPGLGSAWTGYVDTFGRTWELLRRDYFERPWQPDLASPELRALLTSRQSLHQRVRAALPDARLRLAATHLAVLEGHDPRRVPAWVGLSAYLEQNFGAWRIPGGMHQLGTAMAARLVTRKVTVALSTPALDVVVRSGRAVAVRTEAGEIEADAIVVAIDPRRLPTLAPHVRRTTPTLPPEVVHLGLSDADSLPDLGPEGHEVVLHGDPTITLRTGGNAPAGQAAWTLLVRGGGRGRPVDVLSVLAERGVDVREHVVSRVDRSPAALQSGGSPFGVAWDGARTITRRLGPRTPIPGVYAAGAHATPGAGLPFTGLSAALVAQALGPA